MKFDFMTGISFTDIQNRLYCFEKREEEFLQSHENELVRLIDNWLTFEIPKSIEQSDSRFSCNVTKSGSTSEGVDLYRLYSDEEVIESEFDYLFFINDLEINETDVFCVESFVNDNDIDSLHPAHSILGIAGEKINSWEDCLGKLDPKLNINGVELEVVSPSKIMSLFEKQLLSVIDQDNFWKNRIVRIEQSGPAITLIMDFVAWIQVTYSIDIVLAVKNPKWPINASSWSDRKRNWPSKDIVKDITATGSYLVPKFFNLESQEFEWRVSFSYGEHKLMLSIKEETIKRDDLASGAHRYQGLAKEVMLSYAQSLSDSKCRKSCYRLMKYLLKKHLSHSTKAITSYHLKTLFFWSLERLPEKCWDQSELAHCFVGLLDNLISHICKHNIPHYFVPDLNLLGKIDPSDLEVFRKSLVRVRQNLLDYFPEVKLPTIRGLEHVKLTYSDTFAEDSRKAQVEACANWFTAKSLNSSSKEGKKYSFSVTGADCFDPNRKPNTYLR